MQYRTLILVATMSAKEFDALPDSTKPQIACVLYELQLRRLLPDENKQWLSSDDAWELYKVRRLTSRVDDLKSKYKLDIVTRKMADGQTEYKLREPIVIEERERATVLKEQRVI